MICSQTDSVQEKNELQASMPIHNRFSILGAALVLGGGATYNITSPWVSVAACVSGLFLLKPFLSDVVDAGLRRKIKPVSLISSSLLLSKALIATLLAYPVYHAIRMVGSSPAGNFLLHTADPNRKQALKIGSLQDIEDLTEINGNSIETIEIRARQWSGLGFLGYTEHFKDVLTRDWQAVDALGTTHIELAEHIKTIWNKMQYRAVNKEDCLYGNEGRCLSEAFFYDPGTLSNNTIGTGPQLLFVSTLYAGGLQYNIFGKNCNLTDPFWPACEAEENTAPAWAGNLMIYNPINDESVYIGGGTGEDGDAGVIDYIQKYGFYEGGGEENPYRVDPVRLAAVLTGQSVCDIRKAIGQSCDRPPAEQPIDNMEIDRVLKKIGKECVCLNDVCSNQYGERNVTDPSQCLQLADLPADQHSEPSIFARAINAVQFIHTIGVRGIVNLWKGYDAFDIRSLGSGDIRNWRKWQP